MRKSVSDEGLLPIHSAIRIRKGPDARSADQGMLLFGITRAHVFHVVHQQEPHHAGIAYLTAKMAALLPFGRAADFLGELLPLPAVRGCLRRVGIGFGRLRMMPNSPYATDLTNSAWAASSGSAARWQTAHNQCSRGIQRHLLFTANRLSVAASATGVSRLGHGLSLLPELEERRRVDLPSESNLRARSNRGWKGFVSLCRHHG